MAECPFIARDFVPDPQFNVPVNYKDLGGESDYIFYDHSDGFGTITRVQFCSLVGRKKDVFQCYNESEWRACIIYCSRMSSLAKEQERDRLK